MAIAVPVKITLEREGQPIIIKESTGFFRDDAINSKLVPVRVSFGEPMVYETVVPEDELKTWREKVGELRAKYPDPSSLIARYPEESAATFCLPFPWGPFNPLGIREQLNPQQLEYTNRLEKALRRVK